MRTFWIKIDPDMPSEIKEQLIKEVAEYCDGYILDSADVPKVKPSERQRIASREGGNIKIVESVSEVEEAKSKGAPVMAVVTIERNEDVQKVGEFVDASVDYVAVKCVNWKVIPIENLIAEITGKCRLLAFISNVEEAKLMLEALELGVDGVVVEESDLEVVKSIYDVVKDVKTRRVEVEEAERITLTTAKVINTKQLGLGARVCIDTCDLMREGEGMLVGCQSAGMFLVQAEVMETPYVSPRPFRVNAGPVAQYILTPGGKTRYLSELKSGDEVLIVDREGRTRPANICRVKIEWRPMLLLGAECEGRVIKVILQNAETIRLVTSSGHKSIVELEKGEEVLVHMEEGGRHFGVLVKEEKVIEI